MKRYLVGGAVRDALRGAPSVDRDWVVVGASAAELQDAGYVAVGQDFPVFLHPVTHEEHALARTERKVAAGYAGFAFDANAGVTLEQDLQRRDLTINAMAQDESGALIDPYGGRRDLQAKVLRHVSAAFVEDPVRILRVARFAARFADFTVASETLDLMRQMVRAGEVDALVPERVWREVSLGLMQVRPSRMFEVLRECSALARVLPEVDRLWGGPQPVPGGPEADTGPRVLRALDAAAQVDATLEVRFACLGHGLDHAIGPDPGPGTAPVLPPELGPAQRRVPALRALCERLRVPSACRELAELLARELGPVHRSATLDAAATVRLLERCDAIRRPQRFAQLLLAFECDARGRTGPDPTACRPAQRLAWAAERIGAVPTAALAAQAGARGLVGPQIAQVIHAARVAALERALAESPD